MLKITYTNPNGDLTARYIVGDIANELWLDTDLTDYQKSQFQFEAFDGEVNQVEAVFELDGVELTDAPESFSKEELFDYIKSVLSTLNPSED